MIMFAIFAALLLAFANGANDNFKGVATLYGSRTATYRTALIWGTVTTLLGSLLAVVLASELLKRFSGKGLVPDELLAMPSFGASLALGSALTVLAASRIGFPISTTHAIVGSMIGTALAHNGSVGWEKLAMTLLAPLLLSPLVALVATTVIYPILRRVRVACGVTSETCLCAGSEVLEVVPLGNSTVALQRAEVLSMKLDTTVACRQIYGGSVIGIDARKTLDVLHFLTAGLVGFARGLNDTPKIAALLITTAGVGGAWPVVTVAVVMAIGGLAGARRVADAMSNRITVMNAGQGFTGNAVTAFLVTCASRWGMPVSTTHVSCGALFGIGMANGQAQWKFIQTILAAWLITAPVAGGIAFCVSQLLAS
ncbi:MAG: inorganic phosphate transporter [Planctomycetaceae bacterium]|nr:inorganic phosphate transporter [Planctomycetaceae bacterium]